MLDLPISESVYTFVCIGVPTHIAASTLRSALERAQWPVTIAVMGESLAAALEAGSLGVEPAHALTLPDAALAVPCVVCEWGQDHVIADGAHRVWRRWKRGDIDFPAYLVPEPLWREFVIGDMPGSGEFWDTFNRTAEIRTPELEALHKLLGGK